MEQAVQRPEAANDSAPGGKSDAELAEAWFQDGFTEAKWNGRSIRWDFYLQLRTWTAAEFARLARGLDPASYADLNWRPSGAACWEPAVARDVAHACKVASQLQLIAEREGKTEDAPKGWLNWARSRCPRFVVITSCAIQIEALVASDEGDNPIGPARQVPGRLSQVNAGGKAVQKQKRQGGRPTSPWRSVLNASLAKMDEEYGAAVSPQQATEWLKKYATEAVDASKGGKRDLYPAGATKPLAPQTIRNALNSARRVARKQIPKN